MRKLLLNTLAAATILSGGTLGSGAEATTSATPSAPKAAAAHAAIVRQAVNVCGSNGCVQVQTKRVRHQPARGGVAQHI